MFSRARYFLSDLGSWIRSHPLPALAALACFGALAAAVIGIGALDDEGARPLSPAPDVIVRAEEPAEEPADLGFPAFATSNTTRVAGADSIEVAAGVALATFPTVGGSDGPDGVTVVPADDWEAGIAAAALVAEPVGAPILLSDGDELPELSAGALVSLAPRGSAESQGLQVFALGEAPEPEGTRAIRIDGATGVEIAAEVALLRERLTEEHPDHLVIASADEPEFAMPAAAWAARSGDPVLFAQRDSVPRQTLGLIERYEDVPVYVLGGEAVISEKAERRIAEATKAPVRRAAEEEDPVASSIEFARYVDGTFGWNINDPGHGLVIANGSRPADAGAAAALSGTGTFGPLLLTDDADALPAELESYLLDLKPGYVDDPTRAVYNHVWIVGDSAAVTIDFQVEIDELAEVAPIRSGSGESTLGPTPGTPEQEGQDRSGQDSGADGNR